MAWRFMEETKITVALAEFVVQVPVLAATPNTPTP